MPCASSKHYILFERFLMAHFLHVSSAFHANRQEVIRLLTCTLVGSLCGALCARLQASALTSVDFSVKQTSWVPILLRSLLFPSLMAVSFLLCRRYLFYLLFFLKGAFTAFLLCGFALCGADRLLEALPAVFFHSLFPLPVYFYAGSVWLESWDGSGRPLVLLLSMLFSTCVGSLLQASLVL